ncbi:MAG: hypothetical protein ACSLFI_12995 [Solirubrobacterales bacterium]
MSLPPDEPTGVIDGDDEEPTERLEQETGQTEERPMPPADDSRQRGIWMLVASIACGLILIGIYIAAGGLDYKPTGAADPCDARVWTDPGNFEESAQQFALSAVDGAACELGVSREELTRALADDASRQAFAEENGLSDLEIETAVRSGLNRAIDDAEEAGVISGLAVTGLRAAVRFMPLDQMIGLVADASAIFESGEVGDIGDLIEGLVGSVGGDTGATGDTGVTGGTGSDGGSITEGLGDQIEEGIREQLPDSIEKNVPDDVQEQIQDQLDGLINP